MSLPKLIATDPINFNEIMVQTKHGVLRRSAGMPVVVQLAVTMMSSGQLTSEQAIKEAQNLINIYNEMYTLENKKENYEVSMQLEAGDTTKFSTTCMLSGESDD